MNGLSLRHRLALAWKALATPFSAEGAQAAHGLLGGLLRGSQGTGVERNTYELLSTINTSPWVRACAARVADAKAATQWMLYVGQDKISGLARADMGYAQKACTVERRRILKDLKRTGELRQIEQHLFLDMHSANNSYFTGRDVRWLTSIWYDLIGDVFLIKEKNIANKTSSLWPVPPHWVVATPTPDNPFFRVGWRGWQALIPAKEMLWLQNHNPVNPYGRGSGIARAIDDEIANDEYASKHTAAHFKNSARPDVLVMPKEGASFTEPERERFEEFWNQELQGFWRRFKPLFLKAPVDVKVIEQNFRNLQLRELREHERDVIVQTWGVPPELFGIVTSSNRSTIEMAPFIFGQYVMVPRLDKERDYYQHRLIPEYDEKLILDYASPIPEDKLYQLNVMTKTPQYFYANEFRTQAGYPEDPALDGVRMVPSGTQMVDEDGFPILDQEEEIDLIDTPEEDNPDKIDELVDEMSDDDMKALDTAIRRMQHKARMRRAVR